MYQKFANKNKYETTKTPLGNNISHIVAKNKQTSKIEYDVYRVSYNTKYFETHRVFKTLDEAEEYTHFCKIELNKQRFNNRKKEGFKENVLEYPENLLQEIGITPEEYSNYYSEIIPNFEDNFQNAVSKGALSDRLVNVLIDRYKYCLSLQEISKIMNLTKVRIGQLEAKAITRLSHASYKNLLIQGKDKFELISQQEREKLLQEVKAQMTKEVALETLKTTLTVNEAYELLQEVKQYEYDHKFEGVPDIDLKDLDFSLRTFNCLARAQIKNLRDLLAWKEDDLLKIRNLGKKSLKEIKNKLSEYK